MRQQMPKAAEINVSVTRLVVCVPAGPLAEALAAEPLNRAIAAAVCRWRVDMAASPVTTASRAVLARHVELALAELARSSAAGN